jgi:hypothetical protein
MVRVREEMKLKDDNSDINLILKVGLVDVNKVVSSTVS